VKVKLVRKGYRECKVLPVETAQVLKSKINASRNAVGLDCRDRDERP
jgi:hypothetical protein